MSAGLVAGYFLFVLAAVAGACSAYLAWRREPDASGSAVSNALLHGPRSGGAREWFLGLFREVGERVPVGQPAGDPLRRQLAAAGYRYPAAVTTFYGIKHVLAALCGGSAAWISFVNRGDLPTALIAGAVGGFAHMMPDRVLRALVNARSQRLRQAVPVALDLLVLSIEAGQSLNQALIDASAELRDSYPDLSAELAQVHLELRAGKSRADALRQLGERSPEPELRKLAGLLAVADRFGTSLAPALRTHALYLRRRMRQQAQEAARKVSLKLVFPVFFLIFPSVLLVTLGPAILKMMEEFRKIIGS